MTDLTKRLAQLESENAALKQQLQKLQSTTQLQMQSQVIQLLQSKGAIAPDQVLGLVGDRFEQGTYGLQARTDEHTTIPAEDYIKRLKLDPEYCHHFGAPPATETVPVPPNLKNPWQKETWNLTEQGRVYRANPALARQLAEQAGTTLKLKL